MGRYSEGSGQSQPGKPGRTSTEQAGRLIAERVSQERFSHHQEH
jgi:hypothetical protein